MTAMDLRREDAIELERLKKGYRETYQPRNEQERELVDRLATCQWRGRRLEAAETRRLNQGLIVARNNMLGAYEWAIEYGHLDAIQRRESQVWREYDVAMKELTRLRRQPAA